MMKKKLLFIKFGGSILTDKTKPYHLNHEFIDQLLPQILPQNLLDQYCVVLGNGGGSYGHYEAKKANLTGEILNDQSRVGVAQTHLAMQKLQSIVAQKLIDSGWPIWTISPSDIINGSQINTTILRNLWCDGFVPLVHGDIILSQQTGHFEILSTEKVFEKILLECKREYKEKHVILLSDVAGVMKEGLVLEQFSASDKISLDFIKYSTDDVTGGMVGKILSAARLAAMDAKVVIASGLEPNIIKRILGGEKIGTKILI